MRLVRYKQSEFLMPWKWRKKKSLDRFILEIPYALYYSVVPSHAALNNLLNSGSMGGGMGTGVYWEPFELTREEYNSVITAWENIDLRKVLGYKVEDVPDLTFVFDDEILAISKHIDYIGKSYEKYESHFQPHHSHTD